MAETMDVGVVVPLYNKAASVRQSVERLLDQSVRPARVVVVDDGSSDGGGAQLDPLAERLTLVRQPNAGPSAARNRGANLLRTEWVAFADADNLWDVRRLERVRAFLQVHAEVDWLVGRYWNCFPDGRRGAVPPWSGSDGVFTYFDRVGDLPGLHCPETLFVRRTLFEETGGFNERLRCFEITQMYLQLAARRPLVGFLAEPTVEFFCETPSSLYAEKRRSPAVLLAYAEELLALHARLTPPPTYLSRLIAENLRDCVYFAGRAGEVALVRDVARRHGKWLRPAVRWKARLRSALALLRGR